MEKNQLNEPDTNGGSDSGGGNITFRLYSLFIFFVELIIVNIKFVLYTIESIFQAILAPPEEVDVANEIVLITGTAHGIGKELAFQYANKGAKIVCWDINEQGNLNTVQEIKAQGGKAYSYQVDVMNREDVFQTAEQVKHEVGNISILINNAGIMPCHPLLQHTEEEIQKIFGINVLANIWLLQAVLPSMIENNHGHIVALSSCAGLFGLKNLVPYCGSKYAVRGIMQALYEELRSDEKPFNIKLTTVYPYMVDTGLCKNPHMRFPSLMKLIKIDEAATAIIKAQRRGIEEVSIPKYFIYLERLMRLFPKKAINLVTDFLDAGVYSDFIK